ncbi:leucine-rich repeat protein [Sodaliphilus sp.]|uniref:leucine-rich repeat protein n=1 Tax=Sodaliphilus sp. TaxID=2815818 RepID=UPI00388D0452
MGCNVNGSITLPATVNYQNETYQITDIAPYAFLDKRGVTQVTIQQGSLTTIGNQAFCNSGIVAITLPESLTTIGSSVFHGADKLNSIVIPDGVTAIGDRAFTGCNSLKSLDIPERVTAINAFAITNCAGLTSVNLPSTLQRLEQASISGNPGITAITLPQSLRFIGENTLAFLGISSITIPEGVTTIGNSAVAVCEDLESITLPASLSAIDNYGIYGCPKLKNIRLPQGLKTLGEEALSKCGMPYILLPEGLTTIGDGAMSHDNVLKAVNIPSIVTKMEGAFSGLTGARRVYSRIKQAYRPGGQTFVTCIPGFTYGGKTKFYVPKGSLSSYQDVSPWSMMNMLVEEVPGDVDDNNTIDVSDMSEIINHVLVKGNPETAIAADVDRSCDIDVTDINIIINKILNK